MDFLISYSLVEISLLYNVRYSHRRILNKSENLEDGEFDSSGSV